jgi:hypothetical protein
MLQCMYLAVSSSCAALASLSDGGFPYLSQPGPLAYALPFRTIEATKQLFAMCITATLHSLTISLVWEEKGFQRTKTRKGCRIADKQLDEARCQRRRPPSWVIGAAQTSCYAGALFKR